MGRKRSINFNGYSFVISIFLDVRLTFNFKEIL